MVVVSALGDLDAAHLARAIENYERTCRQNGARLPVALRELHDVLTVSGGQERPTLETGPVVSDSDAMSLLHDYDQAARLLGLSERTVRRLVSEGDLRAVEVGRLRRIHRDDLLEYADSLRTLARSQKDTR